MVGGDMYMWGFRSWYGTGVWQLFLWLGLACFRPSPERGHRLCSAEFLRCPQRAQTDSKHLRPREQRKSFFDVAFYFLI